MQLSSIMRIHLIILIIQLKFFAVITVKISDSYKKIINIELLLIYNEGDNFDINEIEVNRIVKKKLFKKRFIIFLNKKIEKTSIIYNILSMICFMLKS